MSTAKYRTLGGRALSTILGCVLVGACLAFPRTLSAQQVTNVPALRALAVEAGQQARAARAEAETWAIENNWPIRHTLPNG